MPCLCLLVYHVVCFFPVLLLLTSSGNVAIVRIRSTMLVRLLHGFDLLPSGISGKMTVTLDLTTIFAMLVVSMILLCRATHHLFIKLPNMPLPNLRSFHPTSQYLASCRSSRTLSHAGTCVSYVISIMC